MMGPSPRSLVHRGVAVRSQCSMALIPSTGSITRSAADPDGETLPGAEPGAARRVRCRLGSPIASSCSSRSTPSAATSTSTRKPISSIGFRQDAVSLLTDPRVKQAFDVIGAEPKTLDRYGRNSFGWSLLMARRLVEAGVNLVQVNLGNNETWDTHGNAFPHLKDSLFPPTDRALSALLDDLHESGLLDSTLIVMAGEFGRTPRISTLPQFYKCPGRDHWGHVQTVFFAGGGAQGRTGRRLVRQDRRLSRHRPANARSDGRHDLPVAGHPPTAPGTTRRTGPTTSTTASRSPASSEATPSEPAVLPGEPHPARG